MDQRVQRCHRVGWVRGRLNWINGAMEIISIPQSKPMIHPPIYQYNHIPLSIHPSLYPPLHPLIHPSICQFYPIRLSVRSSIKYDRWNDLTFPLSKTQCNPNPFSDSLSLLFLFSFLEEFLRVLGFDWLMLFLQGNLHKTTVIQATCILLKMLQHPAILLRFRDGGSGGGWLSETDCILQNRIGVLLGRLITIESNLLFILVIIIIYCLFRLSTDI